MVAFAAASMIAAATSLGFESMGTWLVWLLPLGACMCSFINVDVFAIDHGCRLQIKHGIHHVPNFNQSRNRVQLFQEFVVIVRVHRSINDTG